MRVALRRQRSALSIFSKAFSKAAFTPIAEELKWLAGQFGPARDWDVFVTETLADVYPAFSGHPGYWRYGKSVSSCARNHNEAARNAVESSSLYGIDVEAGRVVMRGTLACPARFANIR